MARRGLFEQLLWLFAKAAVKSIGGRSRRSSRVSSRTAVKSPSRDAAKPSVYKTTYLVPPVTYALASRGMHAYPVVGESFYTKNFEALHRRFGGQDEVYTRGYLVHMPGNPADSNAVAVVIHNLILGHVPRHTAPHFASFLNGRVGACGARFYFNSLYGHHSVELDCEFPPRLEGDPPGGEVEILGINKVPDYSMGQITSRGSRLNWLIQESGLISLSSDAPHFGVAIISEGFSFEPTVVDAASSALIGYPYETISYDFNLFARSWGGSVRVRYKIELQENGSPKVWLDASALPKFKKKKYF